MKKQFLSFFALGAYVLGSIGGFGYAAYSKAWPIAVSVIILAVMAWPQAKKYWQNLNS